MSPSATVTDPLSSTITRSSPSSRAAARAVSTVPDMWPDSGSTTAVSWAASAPPITSVIEASDGWAVVGMRSARARRS